MCTRLFCSLLLVPAFCIAQVATFPFAENFDSVTAPALPPGWITTGNRSTSGDFTTTSSSPSSPPNAVISTNATIGQALDSPVLDFSDAAPESLYFLERRSSSHTSALLVEAVSAEYPYSTLVLSETLWNPGVTGYILRSVPLAPSTGLGTAVRLRWRAIGNGAGTTGTLRIDNILVTARPKFDLSALRLGFSPAHPHAGNGLDITAVVRNSGSLAIAALSVKILIDSTVDPEASPALLAEWSNNAALSPGDSLQFHTSIAEFPGREVVFMLLARTDPDANRQNDTLRDTLSPAFASGSIVINEVMYEPLAGMSEYVELFNRTGSLIDISGWHVGRSRDTAANSGFTPASGHDLLLGPGEFAVVAAESSLCAQFPRLGAPDAHLTLRKGGTSLLNSGDDVVLTDAFGNLMDSLRYEPRWHNPAVDETAGKSLERISPALPSTDRRNWSTCADPAGGTPGRANSLFTLYPASASSLSCSPNPFSPDGDGFEDVMLIGYQLPFRSGVIRIRIFDSVGRLRRILASDEPSAASGGIVWDGLDDNGHRVPIGIYIILLDAYDPATGRTESAKGTVVVATRL